jgi:hypothetical protein
VQKTAQPTASYQSYGTREGEMGARINKYENSDQRIERDEIIRGN